MGTQNPKKSGSNAKRRRAARQKAMQALYQWDFDRAENQPHQVISQFRELQNMQKVDVDYFESLFSYACENIETIDAEISQHLDRELAQLDPIERSLLRICCTELKTQLATPYKVVVNEAVDISKDFGADKGYRYINGIADKLAASLRQIEYQHDHPSGNPLSDKRTSGDKADTVAAKKKPATNVKISIKEKAPPADKTPPAGKPTHPAKTSRGPRAAEQGKRGNDRPRNKP